MIGNQNNVDISLNMTARELKHVQNDFYVWCVKLLENQINVGNVMVANQKTLISRLISQLER